MSSFLITANPTGQQPTFPLDPATVLWAIQNPEGWLIDHSSRRSKALTAYRVIEVISECGWFVEFVEHRQVWAALEYPTLADLVDAMDDAEDYADRLLTEYTALKLAMVPDTYRIPGTMYFSNSCKGGQEVAATLRKFCRWATADEVRAIESGKFKSGAVQIQLAEPKEVSHA